MRNFRLAFIDSSTNVRISTVKDHAATDIHARAMLLYKKQQSTNVCDYTPIARSLFRVSMNATTKEGIRRKFDIAYVMAKKNLTFTKMPSICDLEERHSVDLCAGYKNIQACSMFMKFIEHDQLRTLREALLCSKLFSLQADASTDAGNDEVEVFMALQYDPFSTYGKARVQNTFFCARHLRNATGEGLFESLERAMQYVAIEDWKTKLVGFGCDGVSANIAEGGMKVLVFASSV